MTIELDNGKRIVVDTFNRIHENENGKVECCGILSKKAHLDLNDGFYYDILQCECGNTITIKSEKDWEDDDETK